MVDKEKRVEAALRFIGNAAETQAFVDYLHDLELTLNHECSTLPVERVQLAQGRAQQVREIVGRIEAAKR